MLLLMMAMLSATAGNRLVLKDITNGVYRHEQLPAVQALADGESYAQLSADGQRIVQCSFKTGLETAVLFDAGTVAGEKVDRIDGHIMSPDGGRILIQTATNRIYRHSFTATYYIYNVKENRLMALSSGGAQQTPLWSPDGQQVAFVRNNNIFLVRLSEQGKEQQVTTDGVRNEIINGIPDWVNEEEFSNDRAMVFTADGSHLVWVRYDERQVKQYSMTLFKGMKPERKEFADYPGDYTYKHPIAGELNATVSVWSYDIASGTTQQLQLPLDADGYVPRVLMTSDASRVAVCTMNRHQDCLRIYMCNPVTAQCTLAIEDRSERYVKEEVL